MSGDDDVLLGRAQPVIPHNVKMNIKARGPKVSDVKKRFNILTVKGKNHQYQC